MKTRRSQSDLSNCAAAYEDVKRGTSLRVASERHGVNRISLLRYSRKRDKANKDEGTGSTITMGHAAHNKVDIIDDEEEYFCLVIVAMYSDSRLGETGCNAKENVVSGLTKSAQTEVTIIFATALIIPIRS
ncbi:hypothetical protein EVAR_69820_1 [Eumeta japonica]|uniref:Uncharacterized protein n=1 Tax=Eumeta variegata TaxID=151549 RepID=A0A4C1Z7H1_EUMVA|nr:hypothetical protein EVAR_69820_1 [Eumeta japonica]